MTKLSLPTLFQSLTWWPIALSTLEVYQENEKLKPFAGFAANASDWVTIDSMRRDIWERTRGAWCRKLNRPFSTFPYSIDYVARLYQILRTSSDAARTDWEKQCHAASRQAPTKVGKSRD